MVCLIRTDTHILTFRCAQTYYSNWFVWYHYLKQPVAGLMPHLICSDGMHRAHEVKPGHTHINRLNGCVTSREPMYVPAVLSTHLKLQGCYTQTSEYSIHADCHTTSTQSQLVLHCLRLSLSPPTNTVCNFWCSSDWVFF